MYLAVVAITALGFLVTLAQADPQKITLKSRAKSSRNRARAKPEPSTIPLLDDFLGTDLQYVLYFGCFRLVLISIPANLGGSETYQVLSNINIHFFSLANTIFLVGTPPQELGVRIFLMLCFITFDFGNQVVFDTGSSTLEVASKSHPTYITYIEVQ